MDPCPHCPVTGLGVSCHAVTSQVSRYCELAGMGREDYARLIIERSTGREIPPPPPEPAAPAPDLSLGRRIVHCPWRSTPEGGCKCSGLMKCAAGRGERPGLVTWAECLSCVEAGGPPESDRP